MPSAGEVSHYAYCAHNWWLATRGIDPSTPQGRRAMQALERSRSLAQAFVLGAQEGRQALLWMFRILGLAASATLLAVVLIASEQVPGGLLVVAAAGVATACSAALLIVGLVGQRNAARARSKGLLGALADAGPLMQDNEWNLTGRPDYLMETKEGMVPVDLRGGRAPEHPPAGHRLQMACYLRLLEARDGTPPPFGIIQYRDGLFHVAWNDELREELKTTLAKMKAAAAAGKADRDHDNPNRCRTCARRDACEQKLV